MSTGTTHSRANGATGNLTLSQTFSDYWANVRYVELPQSAIRSAKLHLLDTLAASIAGADATVTCAVRSGAQIAHGSGGVCSLWGGTVVASPATAALVNGTAAHAWELDDFGGCGHSGACVAPAVWAAGEVGRATGKQVILGILAGYDMAARLLNAAGGYSPHNARGWHSTGTCGAFGAAAGAAKVSGLEADQFCSAIGCAGTFVGGTWAFLADGAMTKRIHPGKAAETGLMGAMMARSGVAGPRWIFEAEWGGFLNTYCGEEAQAADFLEDLGARFLIAESGIKPYASCRGIHAALDATIKLIQMHRPKWQSIEKIVIHLTAENKRFVGGMTISTTLDAQMSVAYSVAVALVENAAGLAEYKVRNAHALELMKRIAVVDDLPVISPGDYSATDRTMIELSMRDGSVYRQLVEIPKGGPELPLSESEVVHKAEGLIAPVLGASQSALVPETIMSLDKYEDLSPISKLTMHDTGKH